MLKRKEFYTFKMLPIPSFFLVEGAGYIRFKSKEELKKDFAYYYNKLLAKLNSEVICWNGNATTKSLSSFDYEIDRKGGIVDCNGSVHTTAQSYRSFLKDNDLVIKDWSDGSNKREMQFSDRADIAKQLNKLI